MKRLSLRAKLTLLYTALTTLLVVLVLAVLFSLGTQQILSSTKHVLEQRVSSSFDKIYSRFGELQFSSSLMELEDGVYLSVYDHNDELLYGRLPYGLSDAPAFEDGSIREIKGKDTRYYVLDMQPSSGDKNAYYIRGIISITEAEKNFQNTLSIMGILFPLFVILTAVFGYLMAKRSLAPVFQITATVQEIRQKKDLSQRIALGKGKDEIYHLAATFDELLEQIEALIKREQQFTSDVSHELRTPLSVILMQCDALLQEELPNNIRKELVIIQKKAQTLSNIISQLLLLSRADQGREKLTLEMLDFSELCEMAAEECREKAAVKKIQVSTDIEKHCMIYGDETLLIRLWMNLLNNAVQYGKSNGHIHISLMEKDDILYGSVEDDGCGISAQALPHIWERFYQEDSARSESESSGLGLSMVKWIVAAHHGTIEAKSNPQKGSRFSFQLPKQGAASSTHNRKDV